MTHLTLLFFPNVMNGCSDRETSGIEHLMAIQINSYLKSNSYIRCIANVAKEIICSLESSSKYLKPPDILFMLEMILLLAYMESGCWVFIFAYQQCAVVSTPPQVCLIIFYPTIHILQRKICQPHANIPLFPWKMFRHAPFLDHTSKTLKVMPRQAKYIVANHFYSHLIILFKCNLHSNRYIMKTSPTQIILLSLQS